MEACYLRLLSPARGQQSALPRRWINKKKRDSSSVRKKSPHLSHVRHEPDIFWSSSEFPLSWHGKRKRLLINSWNGAEFSISLLLPLPPHPSYLSSVRSGHWSFPHGTGFCWFITVQVGGNQEAIMAQRASDGGDRSLTWSEIILGMGLLLKGKLWGQLVNCGRLRILAAFGCLRKHVLVKKHYANVTPVALMSFMCEFLYLSQEATGVWNNMHVSSLCLQMLCEIGQAQSKPCGINLACANTLGGLLIIEKASAPINVAL